MPARKTPPLFAASPGWIEARLLLDREANPGVTDAKRQAWSRQHLLGQMVDPPELDGEAVLRAFWIYVMAEGCLEHSTDFLHVFVVLEQCYEQEGVAAYLRWELPLDREFGKPVRVITRANVLAGQKAVLEVSRRPAEQSQSELMDILAESSRIRLQEALQHFLFHDPDLLNAIWLLAEQDSELASFALADQYAIEDSRRIGHPPTGPSVRVATRVITVEVLRELCCLSQANARRLWYAWFEGGESGDESGSQYGRELRKVRGYLESYHRMQTLLPELSVEEKQRSFEQTRARLMAEKSQPPNTANGHTPGL